jgi:hypothetical protein
MRLGYRVTFVDQVRSIYHQVPGTIGMVSGGQLISPTPFSLVREVIYAKWPSEDPDVTAYRDWFTAFECYRNNRVAAGHAMPAHLFDRVLGLAYESFVHADALDEAVFPVLFQGDAPSIPLHECLTEGAA